MDMSLLTLALRALPSPHYAIEHQPMGPTSKEALVQKG
jgi:hypothetical protein